VDWPASSIYQLELDFDPGELRMSERPVTDLVWPGCLVHTSYDPERVYRVEEVLGPELFPEWLLDHSEKIWDWEYWWPDTRGFCKEMGITQEELGTLFPHWTLVMQWPAAPDARRRRGPYTIAELVVEHGQLRKLFRVNEDTVTVVSRAGQRMLF